MTNAQNLLNDEIKALKELMDLNNDATSFYAKAQEKVKDKSLQETLREFELLHKQAMLNFKEQLEATSSDQETHKPEETVNGQANKMFTQVLTEFQDKPDDRFVQQLEEAEDRCLNRLEEAMKTPEITESTKKVMEDEMARMRKSHDTMKSLKDKIAA